MADSMTPTPLQDPDEQIRQWLSTAGRPVPADSGDDLYLRLPQAHADLHGSDLDVAVLVRQLLRRWSLRDDRPNAVATAPDLSTRLRRVAQTAQLREQQDNVWAALPWNPAWLEPGGVPDNAALAGTQQGERFPHLNLEADPFFTRCTGYPRYRTPGQRSACRAVVSAPPGSTIIAMLPTGSGKTEVALCLADQHQYQVTLIIVPTVALAYDFERRFRDHWVRSHPNARHGELYFAWTASTPDDVRDSIRARVSEGRQPLLVTSPESMTRALRQLLQDAAGAGRIGGMVVDEAHLVTQWGRGFRPEFRTLADLRRDLLVQATQGGHPGPVTLLLSATLGAFELRDLHRLFAEPGPCSLVAANALRAEPDLWTAHSQDAPQRQQRVLEVLAHLPRPAILYVTSPAAAQEWMSTLRQAGYGRLAQVTGRTSAEDRARVLQDLRSSPQHPASVDLVVATSAFGLGIDYPHIRTVVHACLPETIDRWYQELGRGGRDGAVSAAFLLTAPPDIKEAKRLVTKVLTAPTARDRWIDLWSHRRQLGERSFIDLQDSRGAPARGSYNHIWNAQLVQGLVELKALQRLQIDVEDLQDLAGLVADPSEHHHDLRDWVGVSLQRGDLMALEFWETHWTPWQKHESTQARRAFEAASAMASPDAHACQAIAQAYEPDQEVHRLFGPTADYVIPSYPCGRCPGCRKQGITAPAELPTHPLQRWAVTGPGADLGDLARMAPRQDGLILLKTDDVAAVAPRLAHALVARGVRHLAGPIGASLPQQEWLFVDLSPISPADLTPCSSFVVYPPASRVPATWLRHKSRLLSRNGESSVFDVLLLPEDGTIGGRQVNRDRALDAMTALQILGG
ncbi:ATP-dependent DNA helicase RecQ [Actinomadura soli]|uniref:DNA 3'-5' helicase n=1 Tax=Actinomadura soli TaxID=2508997 RepID=A0A5C4J8Q4_9ACTN|nr:protein DpdF [Actinomadura soli]TMQ95287.1 ATP-dependent DNA helicase RecQ [Actinomadura soli]